MGPGAVQNVQSLVLIMNSLFNASHTNKSQSHMLKVEKPSLVCAPLKHTALLSITSTTPCIPPLPSSPPTGIETHTQAAHSCFVAFPFSQINIFLWMP